MNISLPTFNMLPPGHNPPPEYTRSPGYITFNVKMNNIRKSRWVKDGHLTKDPIVIGRCKY